MSVGPELLWPGVAALLLLGTLAGLCVRCSRPGTKRTEKIYEKRNLQDRRGSFTRARTCSWAQEAWPGLLMDTGPKRGPTMKNKRLQFSIPPEEPESSRYQSFSKGRTQSHRDYIEPITTDYYNWGGFQKPSGDDDEDTNSYENVLICQPRAGRSVESGGEEAGDYQNSAPTHQRQESMGALGSPEEDAEEPDYVNGDMAAAREAWRSQN